MNKQKILLIFLVFNLICIPISTIKAYTNMDENPYLECVTYNIWDLNNSISERLHQVVFKSPDTFYISGEYILNEDVFLIRFNESQTSLEEFNCSVFEWGGDNQDYFGKSIIDSSGDIYITGSTFSFGAGERDIFLTKINKLGQSLWNRTWGYSSVDAINSDFGGIALDSEENVYVTGLTMQPGIISNVVILKYDPFGIQLWNRTWGIENQDNKPKEIYIDEDDQIYISGVSYGASSSHFLLMYDKIGNKIWETSWVVPMGLAPSLLNSFLFTEENI